MLFFLHEAAGRVHHHESSQRHALHRRDVEPAATGISASYKQVKGFSSRYGCSTLVWYELHDEMIAAITCEKQLKAGSREKKVALIEGVNPDWADLYDTLI